MKVQSDEVFIQMGEVLGTSIALSSAFFQGQQYPLYYYVVLLRLHRLGADHHGDAPA